MLRRERRQYQPRRRLDVSDNLVFEIVFVRSLVFSMANVSSFHQQNINGSILDCFDEGFVHPWLSTMQPQITRVENRLALRFDQEGLSPVDGVIHRECRDAEVSDLDRLSRMNLPMSLSGKLWLTGKLGSGQHHLARSHSGINRNLDLRMTDQTRVIFMSV